MREEYRFRADEGDFVRLQNGETGTIIKTDVFPWGSKLAVVRVDKSQKKHKFYDGEIDELELICTASQLEKIGAENETK